MRPDLELLQGPWTVTALEVDGQKMPDAMLADARLVIKGSRFTSTGMGPVYTGKLKLDVSVSPRRLNMKFDAGPSKGKTNLGIYELDRDTWKLCLATYGTVHPPSFASTPGSGFALQTLSRGDAPARTKTKARTPKKAAATTPSSVSATELEGEWRMVSGIMDGRPMEQSLVKWVKRVTQGNCTTVYAGPNVMMQAEFTSDPTKSPKTIDYLNTAGANKGKRQQGIYEFDGDLLTIYVAAPGAQRPKKCQAAPDSGTLTVWKRA